jgi:hypothetical protein
MLFKVDGPHEIHGGKFDYVIVADADEQAQAVADGWALTTDEARNATVPAKAGTDDAPPTRAELEQKATDLGIKFDGRTTDARLAEKIEAALKD